MGPSPQTSPRATVPIRARLSKARTRFQQRSRSSVFALRAETRAETRDDRGLLLLLNPHLSRCFMPHSSGPGC
ncbi:hypothetical protein NQZ68_029654 [Dissostichus eleginoides]|nr:hypothetical protein NQZ68_029654 [Dissostichus eleginoides]